MKYAVPRKMKGVIGTSMITERPTKTKSNSKKSAEKAGRTRSWISANKHKAFEVYNKDGWDGIEQEYSKTSVKKLRKSKVFKKMISKI